MKKFNIIRWFKNIPIARKLYFTVGIMALLIAIELLTLRFAINTLSALRAYVQGEGLWSKAQKDAVYQLMKYGRTKKFDDYLKFQSYMRVPLGDHKARVELQKQNPDLEIIRKGFLEGRNHPSDISGMIKLFRHFHSNYYISKAISIWNEADSISSELTQIAKELHQEIGALHTSQEKIELLLNRIDPVNQKLTVLEDSFSYTLGEGSRWLENLILKILFIVALTVELTGLLLTIVVSKGLSKGLGEIISASKAVAKGDFTHKAKVLSNDEIGVLARAFNQMTSELENSIRAKELAEKKQIEFQIISKAEKKFRMVLEAAPAALIMLNREGVILMVNRHTEKLTDFRREELIGRNFSILFPEGVQVMHSEVEKFLEQPSTSGKNQTEIEFFGILKGGERFPAELEFNPIETDEGIMVLAGITDLRRRKQIEMQLREAKESAERLSNARQEFLSVMSHEMRTPLNAVVSVTNLLQKEPLTSDQAENVGILKFSAQNLVSLINNILNLSKIESGKLQLEAFDFSHGKLIKNLMDAFRHSAQEKQLKLLCKTDNSIPDALSGDSTRLTQILTNLLHNAIKFTDKGNVELTVNLVQRDSEKVRLRYEISDTGIGIDPDRLPFIFESYSQAKPSIARQYGGTGLGLNISRKIVQLMGGALLVNSHPGSGSVFSVELEFRIGKNQKTTEAEDALLHEFNLDGIKILLVEDNAANMILAKKFLMSWGAKVDVAENGLTAINKVNSAKYDIVLMDLQLPIMDGYEACRVIRDLGFPADRLPVIALSAFVLDEVKTKAKSWGLNDFIPKPIDPNELYQKINFYAKKSGKIPSDILNSPDEKPLNIEDLMQFFDSGFRTEYLSVVENDFKDFFIQVTQSARDKNPELLRQLIHKISGSLKRFENEQLSVLLDRLKNALHNSSANKDEIDNLLSEIHSECESIFIYLRELKQKNWI